MWDNAWAEFIPFLDYDVETRRVICSTNAIESLTAARSRPADTFPPIIVAMSIGILCVISISTLDESDFGNVKR